MEDRNAAQRAAYPFRVIDLELGVHRLEKGAYEGDFEGRADDVALIPNVQN